VDALTGEPAYSYVERTWARPTCDVNGLWSGYQGKGAKTVLPAKAGCKVSFRLVADQKPARIADLVRANVAKVTPPGVTWLRVARDRMLPLPSISTAVIPNVPVKMLCEKLPFTSVAVNPKEAPNAVTAVEQHRY